jgi:eukaryotic-like serine/threonine-protein kinase
MPEIADRIESLFAAVVALAPQERAVYLERECAGDAALRERLLALLRAHDRAGHVIDQPVNGDPDETAGYAQTSEQPGTIVAGRYKLLEEIGEGGMGTVWAAEQTIPVRRKVALKLIKAGMDSRSVLARFEAERQALALMDHPNIAKVLDGGLTDSGRPFFVMEYVKGVPITEYCDATRLTVEERLNLFIQVSSALQHAHQKGIIHRDLKPSNILVGPYDDKPVPKVIDFGLAKAMHQSLTEKTLYTAHETVLGTPLYMSPEQAQLNNLDVDTRADIYSLGVLLYELLTGTTPIERQRFKEAAWDEVRRMIREEEPSRPSMRLSSTDTLPSLAVVRHTEPAKLKKLVRGELDWIVMKALEKDRTRRYETANSLSRDIQRFLDNEVVEARPHSAGYRIGKFVRRHRAPALAAGLVLLVLLAGIAGTTWGLIREARAKTRLAESLDRETKANADLSTANSKVLARYDLAVDAVKTFHTGVSEDFLLKEEKFNDLRNRLLKSASDFYEKLSALLGSETDLASRRAMSDSNFELAELTEKVGHKDDALAMHQAVLAAREALAREPGAETRAKVDVGRSLTSVADTLFSLGRSNEALATYRRSESLLAGLAGSDPAARAAAAACRTRMASLLRYDGKTARALAACRLARTDQELLAALPGASNEARRELAETVDKIGYLLWVSGKYEEAVDELQAAMAIYQKLADENPDVVEFRYGLGRTHFYLGNVLPLTGRTAEGVAEFHASLNIFQSLTDGNAAVTRFRRYLGLGRNYFANLLLDVGKPMEAEAECRKALALLQKLVDDDPTASDFRSVLEGCHQSLGTMLLQAGKRVEAEIECRKAQVHCEKLLAENPSLAQNQLMNAIALAGLGDVVRSSGRAADARLLYDRAIDLEQQLQDDPTFVLGRHAIVSATRRRGLALRDLGDDVGAAADASQALRLADGLESRSFGYLLELACCHAALAGLAGQAGSGVSAFDGEREATKAMDWLRQAVANGFRNTNQLRTESALDPLRHRPDFRHLMMDVVFPSETFAPLPPTP